MKVMLDECITRQAAKAVIEWLKLSRIEGFFLVDVWGSQGARDCDWSTAHCTPPNEWIVISTDSGSKGPRIYVKGPPLHLILPAQGVFSVFLKGKLLSQCPGREKASAIIATFPKIAQLYESGPAGARISVVRHGDSYKVQPWPVKTKADWKAEQGSTPPNGL